MINNENNVFNILQVVIRRRWIATWTTMLPKKITNQQGFFLIWWEFEPAQCSYIFHSLSTWWQLSYSQLLWHHTGDGKLIIYVLWNSYLSTCVDLCSYAFDLTKKGPTGWSVHLAQTNSDQSSLLCRSDSFRKEEMQHKPKLDHVWLGNLWWWFVIKLYDCLLNSLKKLKPLLNIFT